MSFKRVLAGAMIAGGVAGCISFSMKPGIYVPRSVSMDARAAQDEVRNSVMYSRYVYLSGVGKGRVGDVRFRNDGVGLLFNVEGGSQLMQACYYSGMENVRVDANNDYYPFLPAYAVGPICSSGTGWVWLDSEPQAKRLADAMYSLKNGAH